MSLSILSQGWQRSSVATLIRCPWTSIDSFSARPVVGYSNMPDALRYEAPCCS